MLLQAVVVFAGGAGIALLLWEPHIEGRNATASLSEIYFHDPFLAFVYVASIPFFVALYQIFRLLGWVGSPQGACSERGIRSARLIRSCVRLTIGFVVVGVAVLMFVGEERPPALFMGFLVTCVLVGVGSFATALEGRLKWVGHTRPQNDPTT